MLIPFLQQLTIKVIWELTETLWDLLSTHQHFQVVQGLQELQLHKKDVLVRVQPIHNVLLT